MKSARSGSAISGRAAGHRSCSCTACSRTVGSGGGRSTARDQFSVVAWDARSCGASTDPSEQYRMADYADCLAAFIEALELDRPHVLGLSF
jgi:pimeloyl-ACP methyl ester carboxylesterase